MSEPEWRWWVSGDEESYTGPYDSREEAIEVAVSDEVGLCDWEEGVPAHHSFYIMEAYQQDIQVADHIDVGDMVVRWEENDWEEMGNPNDCECVAAHVTSAQWDDLQARLRYAARTWQAQHAIVIKSWAFHRQRNNEHVWVAIPDESEAEEAAAAVEDGRQP